MQEARELSESEIKSLQNYELGMKRSIMDEFGIFLPAKKVALLSKEEYIDYDYVKIYPLKTMDDIYALQGKILRDMLDSLIDLTCEKKLEIEPNNKVNMEYGRDLENGIIEYYAQKISTLKQVKIDKPVYDDNLEMAMTVYSKLKQGLNPNVFKYNAIGLLDLVHDDELTKKCDQKAINKYLNGEAVLNSIPALRYIDENKQEEILTDIKEQKEEIIKQEELSQKVTLPHETVKIDEVKIDAENLKEEKSDKNEIKITDKKTDDGYLNFEDIEMDSFITHDNLENINFSIPQDEIKKTEPILNNFTPKKVEPEKELSDEEKARIDEIISDYASGKKITDEELSLLVKAMPELDKESINTENIIEYTEEDGSPTLSFNSGKYLGFANKNIIVYLIVLTVIVGFILGIILFKIIN